MKISKHEVSCASANKAINAADTDAESIGVDLNKPSAYASIIKKAVQNVFGYRVYLNKRKRSYTIKAVCIDVDSPDGYSFSPDFWERAEQYKNEADTAVQEKAEELGIQVSTALYDSAMMHGKRYPTAEYIVSVPYANSTENPIVSNSSINAAKLDYSTPELKKLRKAIQSIVVDNDAEFVQLVDAMINNATINYVPETRALKRCIDNMLEFDSEREVRNWVLKYAADLGCIDSDNINSASTCVNAATDVDTERYLHSLVGDVESALANEVDSVNFEQDNNNLYVTITYMSVTQEYAFGFSELTMLWDSIDEDTSYIVNTILQGLDTMGDSVISSTDVRRGRNMKKYVKAAEDDYIKIGNMVIPKNAASYGYDSFENIARDTKKRYDSEKAAERKAAEDAAKNAEAEKLRKAGEALYQECGNAVDTADTVNEKLEALFEILVPSSGQAETFAGELVRAVMRIGYRWYNDGDYFYTGYGLETCGSSAAFIADKTNDDMYNMIMDATDNMGDEGRYENFIALLEEDVLDYVMSNPEAFGTKSEDSRNYESPTLDEFEERSRSYEFDVDTSGEDIAQYVENGCISWSDFEYWLGELTNYYGGRVSSWARDGFTIVDLNQEEYEEWEEMYEKELDSYLQELEQEFPNYGLEEEDEEEYYDEEEEY